MNKIKNPFIIYIFLALILLIGIFLRFYHIEHVVPFGWDQARDAFQTSYLLKGNILLEGPKTGIGNFHLGPLYFYLLAPFFFFTHLDPIASQYLNIFLSSITFVIIFYVTKKLFSLPFAFLLTSMYAINTYVTDLNRIPWNVSLVPPLSFLIFYFTYQTFTKKTYTWSIGLMSFCGMFFHAHFTAIAFPIMLVLLLLVNNDRVKMLKLFLASLPFYLLWYLPTIIDFFATSHSQYFLLKDFFTYYFIGFHLKFVLHRLPDVIIQFRTLLLLPAIADYMFIISLGASYFFTKRRIEIKIIFAWMLSTLFIFGMYGGPISDYYFFFTMPAVFYAFLILIEQLFKLPRYVAITVLTLFLVYYSYSNLVTSFGVLQRTEGLAKQKAEVKTKIRQGAEIKFNEGDIKSYLYLLYKKQL